MKGILIANGKRRFLSPYLVAKRLMRGVLYGCVHARLVTFDLFASRLTDFTLSVGGSSKVRNNAREDLIGCVESVWKPAGKSAAHS